MKTRAILGLAPLFLVACAGVKPAEPPPIAPVQAPMPAEDMMGDTDGEAAAAPEEPKAPEPVVAWKEGLAIPESVLVDAANDRYLVSNINGKPLDADNNGYIAELSPDGKVTNGKFIAGGTGKVKLDAPKGMGISKGFLYVADITVVRKFDAKTGAPKGESPVAGATFLNDVAVAANGSVYVSDSGMKAGEKDFEPTGTDAVYVIDKFGKAKPVAKSADLGRPNGLLTTETGILAVTFGTNELYRLSDKGEKLDVTGLPAGGLDGLAAAGDSLLVSSWQASAVFRGKLGGEFKVALSGLSTPADIAYDAKRKRVIVPRFMSNAVEAYALD